MADTNITRGGIDHNHIQDAGPNHTRARKTEKLRRAWARRSNKRRAADADRCIALYCANTGADWGDGLADLLCDLMHLARRDCELDFERDLERAIQHYMAEALEAMPM